MWAVSVAAYRLGSRSLRDADEFSFGPIGETGVLFLGILLKRMPALQDLGQHGQRLGFERTDQDYLAPGSFSSALDNAPTYLNFLTLEEPLVPPEPARTLADCADAPEEEELGWMLANKSKFVVAVSLGSVFFGAMTYVGNGPNLMVESIAESSHVRVPSFFGDVFCYSVPLLLPVLLAVG